MALDDVIKARGKTGGSARSGATTAGPSGRNKRRGGAAKVAEVFEKKVAAPARTNAEARGLTPQATEKKPRPEGAARGFMAAAKAALASAKATAVKSGPPTGSSVKARQMAATLAGSGAQRQSARKDVARAVAPKTGKAAHKTEDKLAMTLDDVIKTQVKPKGGAEAKAGAAKEHERVQGRLGIDAAGKRGRRTRIVKLGQGRKSRRRAGAAPLLSTSVVAAKTRGGRARAAGKAKALSGIGGRTSNRLARRLAAVAAAPSSWGPAWRSNLPPGDRDRGGGGPGWRRSSNSTPDWDAHDRREPGGVSSRGDFGSMDRLGAGFGMKRMMAASLGREPAAKRMRLSAGGGRDFLDEPWGARGAAPRLGGRGGPGSVLFGERLRESMGGLAALGSGSGRRTPFDADWGATPKGRAVQQTARELTRLGRPREAESAGTQIRVANVPRTLDCRDIKEAFEDTGKVIKCEVERGVARVTFKNAADAKRAVNTFDRGELNGQTIFVTLA